MFHSRFIRCVIVSGCLGVSSLATTVTNTNDSGPGSLRQAIAETPPGGTVSFALSGCPCTITLTSGELVVDKRLTITGLGANLLTVSGDSGFNTFPVFWVGPPSFTPQLVPIVLENMTIANGSLGAIVTRERVHLTVRNSLLRNNSSIITGSAGIHVNSAAAKVEVVNSLIRDNRGIAIKIGNDVDFVITDSTIANNIPNDWGIGLGISIEGYATATIERCTIEGNTAISGASGIYTQNATTTLINSTISGNSVAGTGAAIVNLVHGNVDAILRIYQSTITKNTAGNSGVNSSAVVNTGLENSGVALTIIQNSIIADNASGQADLVSTAVFGGFISNGHNLIGNPGIVDVFNRPGDQAGTQTTPLNPRLEPLAFNGGPTRSHALKLNSSAIDKGFVYEEPGFFKPIDQRSLPRPSDNPDIPNAANGSDIGAFEVQFPVSGNVTLSGRVIFTGSVARSKGQVRLVDSSNNVRWASVNPTGYYRFHNVPLGRSFTVSLYNKGWTATPLNIFTAESVSSLDLTASRSHGFFGYKIQASRP